MIRIERLVNIRELLKWRKEVIVNVFAEDPSDELMKRNESYYRRHISENTHLAFVAFHDEEEAGCGGICFTEELPSPDNPTGRCGYLMNIYVRDKFREKGIAHKLVTRLIEEAKIRDCRKIYLETTDEGRHLYESLGFKDLPDILKLAL